MAFDDYGDSGSTMNMGDNLYVQGGNSHAEWNPTSRLWNEGTGICSRGIILARHKGIPVYMMGMGATYCGWGVIQGPVK